MADLIISYFDNVDKGCAGSPIKSETVNTSTTTAASGAIPEKADVAVLYSTVAHYVTFGEGTPTAAASNSFYLPASTQMWLRTYVGEGQTRKFAAITA